MEKGTNGAAKMSVTLFKSFLHWLVYAQQDHQIDVP